MGKRGIEVVRGIDQFLNIAYSVDVLNHEDPTHLKFPTSFTPSQISALERIPEGCNLKIALLADNLYRKEFFIDLVWRGAWNNIDAIPFDTSKL